MRLALVLFGAVLLSGCAAEVYPGEPYGYYSGGVYYSRPYYGHHYRYGHAYGYGYRHPYYRAEMHRHRY